MKITHVFFAAIAAITSANAQISNEIAITEFAYDTIGHNFFELTNISNTAVDLTNWSFDNQRRMPGSFSLSSLGILAPGESAIVCRLAAATFRTEWGLPATVKILGNSHYDPERADEINIYNPSLTLIARLTYNDQNVPANGPRTDIDSAIADQYDWANESITGVNSAISWHLSGSTADTFGITWTSLSGTKGSPGVVQPFSF